MIINPFPGPQPYRGSERERFFGREELARRIESSIGANRCVTLYGPSGAGKSSLLRAAVLPRLVESSDVRVVHVDSWPEMQDPTRWLAVVLYAELRQGTIPVDASPAELVQLSVKRAALSSSRTVIVVLDQFEQLLEPGREPSQASAFFACLDELLYSPSSRVHIVISLREDYLGRFRERLRDRDRLLRYGVRVGALTVGELSSAVCRAAASGTPPQAWSIEEARALMLQVRAPGAAASDDAEAQSAYAQIVCRELFERRARGEAADEESEERGPMEAESILRGYLNSSFEALGPLRAVAERLLEEQFVTAEGGRTIRTEQELLQRVPGDELAIILGVLEGTAILRAEEHQGTRYFELGHDWLARKVFEWRKARETEEAIRRRDEQIRSELAEADARRVHVKELWYVHDAQTRALAEARRRGRALAVLAVACLFFALAAAALGVFAYRALRAGGSTCPDGPRRGAARCESPRAP